MTAASEYNLALFLHVVGVLGIAAAYTIDTLGLIGLRRSTTGEEARAWLVTRRWVLLTGPPSIGLVLVTGVYMMIAQWGWVPWDIVALASLLVIAVTGGLSTALSVSVTVRIAITIGIAFLMALKPDLAGSFLTIAIAGTFAAGPALVLGMRHPSLTTP